MEMRWIHIAVQYVWGNYLLMGSLAAILFSITQVGIKLLSKSTSIFQVFCSRSLFVCIAMYIAVKMRGEALLCDPSKYRLLILRTVAASLTFMAVHFSTHLLSLVEATFLVNSYPMTTAILSFLMGTEHLSWKSWTGVVGCIVGNTLILKPPFITGEDEEDWDGKRVMGVILALLSTVFTSMTAIYTKLLGASVSPYGVVFFAITVVLFMSIPFVAASFPDSSNWSPNLGQIGLHVLIIVSGIMFHPTFCRSFQIGPPTKTGIIMLTNMLYSAVFGILVMSDDASWYTLLGAFFIIISVVVISLDRPPPKDTHLLQSTVEEDGTEPLISA
eukprot:g7990.t1